MGDILDKIFAVILVVILMFFFPLLDAFERIDDLSYMTVYAATVKFVDAVRTTGHITPEMYSEFVQKINSTGNRYKIEMSHKKSMYYPSKDYLPLEEGHGSVKLEEEINTEQILYSMGYYEYDDVEKSLKEKQPAESYANFAIGDYFYVSVQNETATPATVIKRVIYGNNVTDLTIMVPYGGLIQNDSNRKLSEIEVVNNATITGPAVTPPVTPVTPPTVSLASVAKVGDYVKYEPDGATTSYTISPFESAFYNGVPQVIARKDINWQVLKIDGETVTLISEEIVDAITLEGAVGYLNGPNILNTTYREVYSGSQGTARHLMVEDVNEIMGFDGDDETNWMYSKEDNNILINVPEGIRTIGELQQYLGPTDYGYIRNRSTPSGSILDYMPNYYTYTKSEYVNSNNREASNLIFNSENTYWLASQYNYATFNVGARFGMRAIVGEKVDQCGNMYWSTGSNGGFRYFTRPIVELNAGIEYNEEASGDGSSASSAWVLE